jgi:hypothetical protein
VCVFDSSKPAHVGADISERIAMTAEEFEAVVEKDAGSWRDLVKSQLHGVAERLGPQEQLTTVAMALRLRLVHGLCVVAVTDRRVMLLWTSKRYEEYDYEALISVSHDPDIGEITLVTSDAVRTLRIRPLERAAEIVAVVAARIGEDRVHPRAGATEARLAMRALVGAAVTTCIAISTFVVTGIVQRDDGRRSDRATPDRISAGQCLDVEGFVVSCRSTGAVFVVLGERGMARCPAGSATIAKELSATSGSKRGLAPWCIGVKQPGR